MIHRTSFFVACLWAPLPAIGMLVGACVWMALFPRTVQFFDSPREAAGVALIAVPFIYAVLFAGIYVTVRALFALNVLSIWTLLGLSLVASFGSAALVWTSDVEDQRVALLMVVAFVGTFVALAGSALLWWRVALNAPQLPPSLYEKRRTRSGSRRRRDQANESAQGTASPAATSPPEPPTDELIVRWNASAQRLQFVHPDRSRYPAPLAELDEKAFAGMSAQDAAKLIGEPLTRLLSALRSRYDSPSKLDDAQNP